MQRNLKTVMRLLMTKQQRRLAMFNKLNTISLDSSKSSSNDSVDISMPKMLDRGKARQQYIEVVDTLIDECKKKKQTLNDLKLYNEICTNKELSCINLENENINEDNISENFYNKQSCYHDFNIKEQSNSLNKTSISNADLLHTLEEQKVRSPRSWLSVYKLMNEVNHNAVQYFDEVDN